jgi:hypothetical protein
MAGWAVGAVVSGAGGCMGSGIVSKPVIRPWTEARRLFQAAAGPPRDLKVCRSAGSGRAQKDQRVCFDLFPWTLQG